MNKEEVATPKIIIASLGGLFGKRSGWWTGGLRENHGKQPHIHRNTHLPFSHPTL
jgi:hypothetical protein